MKTLLRLFILVLSPLWIMHMNAQEHIVFVNATGYPVTIAQVNFKARFNSICPSNSNIRNLPLANGASIRYFVGDGCELTVDPMIVDVHTPNGPVRITKSGQQNVRHGMFTFGINNNGAFEIFGNFGERPRDGRLFFVNTTGRSVFFSVVSSGGCSSFGGELKNGQVRVLELGLFCTAYRMEYGFEHGQNLRQFSLRDGTLIFTASPGATTPSLVGPIRQ